MSTQYLSQTYLPRGTIRLDVVERWIVYLGVILAPFSDLRFPDVFFSASDLCFSLSFIILLLTGKIGSKPLLTATQIWLYAFLLLFLGLFIGIFIQDQPDRGVIVIGQYLFAYIISMVVLVRRESKEAHRLAALLILSIIVVDLHGIYTFYAVGYEPTEGKSVVTGSQRLATVLGNPNIAAALNVMAMPALLYFWSSRRLRTHFALPLFAVMMVTIILTSSNSGLLTLVACLSVYTASVFSSRLTLRLLFGGAVLIGALSAFGSTDLLPATFQKRVLPAISSGDITEAGTYVSRAKLAAEAVKIILEDQIALVGIGADEFRERSVQRTPVHVLYLLLWVEGGLLSLIGWLLFPGAAVVIWFAIRGAGGEKHVLGLLASATVIILTVALFTPHMYARYWTLPLFVSFGLSLTHLKQLRASKELPVEDV